LEKQPQVTGFEDAYPFKDAIYCLKGYLMIIGKLKDCLILGLE